MDQRLKEVPQTDLAEGRLIEEFLDWLKTKGVSWLLVAMVALCAYFGIVRWRTHQSNYEVEAWDALTTAKTPSALEEIADKYAGVESVPLVARIDAARRYMNAVQADQSLATVEGAPRTALTEEDRTSYLDRADRLYQSVLAADDNSGPKTLFMLMALNGRAAVAESRGNLEDARKFFEQAAARAEAFYPGLAQQARANAATVMQQERVATLLPAGTATRLDRQPPSLTPITVDPWLSKMLFPATEESNG